MKKVTIADNQKIRVAKKLKEMFGHIDIKQEEYCPIRDVMALATDKWSIMIILYLGYYPVMRFSMYPEVPIRVEYSLTDFGHSYLNRLIELTEWATSYGDTVIENRKKFTAS